MGKIVNLTMPEPNEKQRMAFEDTHKHVGYGGARGGGKSFFVRWKAILLSLNYAGIKVLIVRRTYPELINNHIRVMKKMLYEIASYNDKDKIFSFQNNSTIQFTYCAKDGDLDRLQGTEYDIIFFDEATQLTEYQIKSITACLRGVNEFPKRIYYTCNPGGQSHHYFKRIFIDRRYLPGENAEDYSFIQSLVTDNKALMEADEEYKQQLEALPEKLKQMWLYGNWNVAEGMFFEDFTIGDDEARQTGEYTHVINPFDVPRDWKIYRSFDWGYNKPFSVGWWAIDYDGRLYRIEEWYGCVKNNANTGLQMSDDNVFKQIHEIESNHQWLKGKHITGIADPAIWQKTTGISIADTAAKNGIYFTKGDNNRIAGWMQMHYRFAFDKNGVPMCYVFNNCVDTIRTLPTLMYDEHKVEDLDTNGEDHIADEFRYMCNRLPIKPVAVNISEPLADDPINMISDRLKSTQKRSRYILH